MDLDPTISAQYGSPTSVFQDIESLVDATGPWKHPQPEDYHPESIHTPWHLSQCNPATRINTLEPLINATWIVDGSQDAGRRLYAWPAGLHPRVAPMRIDIWIEEPAEWQSHLTTTLQSSASVHTKGMASANLGITQHVIRALELWSNNTPNFDQYYRMLPFGSRIVVKNITARIEDIKIEAEEYRGGAGLANISDLRGKVSLPSGRFLPVCVDINSFELLRTLSETVSLVRLRYPPPGAPQNDYIMKASMEFSDRIYRELAVLLALPEHPCIIKAPIFLVTCNGDNHASSLVIGFVLEYHPEGSLRDALAIVHGRESHHWIERIIWAKQLVSSLIFLNQNTNICYGEIKTENIVLSRNSLGGRDIVMIDFESHGAGDIWTAPEMGHLENLRSIIRGLDSAPCATRSKFLDRFKYLAHFVPGKGAVAAPFENFTMSDNEKENYGILDLEAIQVFRLGLVLFCVFENVGWPKIRISSSWAHESTTQFPNFVRTPSQLRTLILKCTEGAREHISELPSLIRRGNRIYPKGMTGLNGEARGQKEDVVRVSRQMWLGELEAMERFFEAKRRYDSDCATKLDLEHLSYLRRPPLEVILKELEQLDINTL